MPPVSAVHHLAPRASEWFDAALEAVALDAALACRVVIAEEPLEIRAQCQ
jgi:hypothetical protein